jgi:hypothetical protein
MVFKTRAENGGVIDQAINSKGRPQTKLTNRQLREREMLALLRKLKPHVAEAIATAAKIMRQPDMPAQHQLRAATILLDNYKQMVGDLFDKSYDEDTGEEVQVSNKPLFSMQIVNAEGSDSIN